MPIFNTRGKFTFSPPDVGSSGTRRFDWDDFSGGLNTLFKETELENDEMAQATNIQLVGKGIPTKASGTALYYTAGATGAVRGMSGFYQKDGTNQLLAVTDDGYLTSRNGDSYSTLTGVSWASGYNAEMVQLDNKMYIVNGQRELAVYSNPTLVGFPTISPPSAVFATQISGASGTNTYSYRLTAVSDVGETLPSDAYFLANQPDDPIEGSVKVSWTNASVASGVRKGTNIYGRSGGNETFLSRVDGEATQWIDNGSSVPQLFAFAPLADSTGGPVAKYAKRFKDRMVFSGIAGEPEMVMISGRVPNHTRFDGPSGGGIILIEPGSGDEIVGLETKGDKILVFKQRSIWEVDVNSQVEVGNFFLLEPKARLITSSIGSAGQRTIAHVENDIFFMANANRGIFVIGNEPGIIGDILRTNEISVKIRPFFENLTATEQMNAAASYHLGKYYLTIPGKTQTMVFDRERQAWLGPWTFDGRLMHTYYDSSDVPHLLVGEDTMPTVVEISDTYQGHKGVAMNTILKTKREDMGNWETFKNIQTVFTRWRSVTGSVNVDIRLEGTQGNTITQKNFNITTAAGNAGWGADQWGNTQWGDTEESGSSRDLNELVREVKLDDTARNIEFVVKTNGLNDNYELMAIKTEANEIGPGIRPAEWRIT